MRFAVISLGALLLGVTHGRAIDEERAFEVFEELHLVPEGWKAAGSPHPDTRLSFRIALNAAKPELLEKALYDISTPGNARYGQHLERHELKAILEPSPAGCSAVLDWLKTSGVKANDIDNRGEWVNFVATAKQANMLMDTNYLVYRSLDNEDAPKIRTTKVSLPRNVKEHIKMIHPSTRFTKTKAQMNHIYSMSRIEEDLGAVDASCNSTITPTCLRELYSVKGVTISDPKKTGFVGVAGFLKQYARFEDLRKFVGENAKWASATNFTWSGVNGGVLDQAYSGSASEANLDIQYTVALSHPVRNHFYSTSGLGKLVPDLDQPSQAANQNEPYLEFLQHLIGLAPAELPHTITFSYGEDEQSVPATYAKQVCDMIAQLGTRGVSMIFSSGDTGVGSACQTNDGKNTTRFLPIFPAACPYVTAVGGTVGVNPERAVGFSSGGFSDRWPRPAYQEKAVKGYLDKIGKKWSGYYNPSGRGFPDVAAQGVNFRVVDKGRTKKISGTSASAPAFAGLVGLLNAKRLQDGKPALGFLNPWLYSVGEKGANDIVNGGSTGCTGSDHYSGLKTPKIPGASWAAMPGWDAVTGLGTPKFDQLLKNLPQSGPKRG